MMSFPAPTPSTHQEEPPPIAMAGLVHDLGNLIQIAVSALNIIARTPGMPPEHTGPMLNRARTSLDHAGEIVRQNMRGIRNHVLTDNHSDIDLCLADVAMLVDAMDEPGLALEMQIERDLPAIGCDPTGLRRAILNLILNARDAMYGTGVVTIGARTTPRKSAALWVELEVADHGVGMSRAMIARAFDPFFTTKTDGLGGIGLPMVERFALDAGGGVSIRSTPGAGTRVTLRLPAGAAPTAAAPSPETEESDR